MMAVTDGLDVPGVNVEEVRRSLSRHLALYRHKAPAYQTVMLNSLLTVWKEHHERLLDIGGGTGVIAQCIQDLFPVGTVETFDVVDRFCPDLSISARVYDGSQLPCETQSMDAATINNVVHHIPPNGRVALFRQIRRVVRGPLYIKDHVAASRLDHARLALLDLIGNTPFSGMVKADYLSAAEWSALADESGYRIAETVGGTYRKGLFAAIFPNRLEVTMRWDPV